MGQSPHPTSLSIFNSFLVNCSSRNRKQLWLLPVDMLQVMEYTMVTHAERERVSHGIYLHSTVILIFIPFCSIWAEQKFIWCHPLIKWRSPLRGYFVHHPLLPQVNLQVLSNVILECWPGTVTATCSGIVKTGLPWFVPCRWYPSRRSCYCPVWYLSIFHSKGLNGACCEEKDKLLVIYIHLHSF